MDPFERDRIDRMNREAELEKAPDDPEQPVGKGDSKPLIVDDLRRPGRDRDRARHHVGQRHTPSPGSATAIAEGAQH